MTGHARSDAGYTLAEMLAALVIVALTTSGLLEAGALIGRRELAAARAGRAADGARTLQGAFSGVLAGAGPFRSDRAALEGEPRSFRFPCGEASCGAELDMDQKGDEALELRTPAARTLSLGPLTQAHFVYVGTGSSEEGWPADGPPQRLKAVLLVSHDGAGFNAVASAQVWRQEQAVCAFDTIARECRGS